MEEIKQVLSQLESALSILQKRTTEVEKVSQDQESKDKKFDEIAEIQKAKDIELDEREAKVKHIESIDEASENAKKLMVEAQAGNEALDKRREEFNADIAKEKTAIAKDLKVVKDGEIANVAQAEALKKERKEFEDSVRAFKAVQAALK